MAIETLKKEMTVARIFRAMDIPKSSINYRKIEGAGKRKSRISENMEENVMYPWMLIHVS